MEKAVFSTEGDHLQIGVPITKVDKAKRTVEGFATLDNPDQQDDIVTAEASKSAFARWRGNVREMHAPVAVGKALEIREEKFLDPLTEKLYNGVWVKVYVSTGAEDTWQKVLDGTLSGFSIGGSIKEAETEYDYEHGRLVRFVKDYDLTELSLVDNPANQFANVFSIVKSAEGTTITGIAVGAVENIFACNTDGVAIATAADSVTCTKCGDAMTNIGWVESDAPDKAEKVKKCVDEHRDLILNNNGVTNIVYKFNTGANTTAITSGGLFTTTGTITGTSVPTTIIKTVVPENEGGGEMTTEKKEETVTETETTTAVVEETATDEPKEEEKAEETAEVEEVEAEELDLKKMFSELSTEIANLVKSGREELESTLTTVKDSVEDVKKTLDEKISELRKEFGEQLSTATETVSEVAKRVDAVESDTAIKKSADRGGSEEELNKKNSGSFWGSAFLSTSDL